MSKNLKATFFLRHSTSANENLTPTIALLNDTIQNNHIDLLNTNEPYILRDQDQITIRQTKQTNRIIASNSKRHVGSAIITTIFVDSYQHSVLMSVV